LRNRIKGLSTEDRKQLKQNILVLARMIDVIEIDNLLEEHN